MTPDDGFRVDWETHREAVFRAARRVLGSDEDALDIAQETSLEFARQRAGISPAGTRAWLVRVATNRAIDRLRRRDPISGSRRVDEDLAAPAARRDELEADEFRGRIRSALATLAPRQAEVVVLRIYEEMTFADLSCELGISEGAAKMHFRRAIDHLRERLGALAPGADRLPTDAPRSPR